MTTFLRLLNSEDKAVAQQVCSKAFRSGAPDSATFAVAVNSFSLIPGSPFAYWTGKDVREAFSIFSPFESNGRMARVGLQSSDDFRFLRAWWETRNGGGKWLGFAKGGTHSPFYADVSIQVNWRNDGLELKSWAGSLYGSWSRIIKNAELYARPGVFQTLRAASLAPHLTPAGCIFSDNGTQAFSEQEDLLPVLAILNSKAADYLHKLLLGRAGYALYRNGTLARLPVPDFSPVRETMGALARRCWSNRRILDEVRETSHAFLLPSLLRPVLGEFNPFALETEFVQLRKEIDQVCSNLYGFANSDWLTADYARGSEEEFAVEEVDSDDAGAGEPTDEVGDVLSWAVGVAFGRFDIRLATGERDAPAVPEPLDPLPDRSPGMLLDGAARYHAHLGILVDDKGHSHDLAGLVEEVLARVNFKTSYIVRSWLQRDFFAFHLQRYSKSRRKAPIYWPLSTTSGSYTLWVYYPSLSSQTLYTAINDFVEPKLKQVGDDVAALRNKGSGRTRDDEKQFEALQSSEAELLELRDKLQEIAPGYKPNHDDGVQITAAPLWPLFRHKPWQKLLKDTWAKLEKGDYDWANLALANWPDRVRERCKTDKSLAIAHGLEDLYVEPEAAPKKTRSRKKATESE